MTRARSVLLIGHGLPDRDIRAGEIGAQAARLTATGQFDAVACAALRGSPSPIETFSALPEGPVRILPMLMADGDVMQRRLPAALAQVDPTRVTIAPPLGLASGLVGLLRRRLTDWHDRQLVLIAHGSSRNDASRRATIAMAAALIDWSPRVAFIDEDPRLAAVLADLTGPAVTIGLFADRPGHVERDVDPAIAVARAAGQDLHDLGPVGADPDLVEVLLEQALAPLP